MSDEDLNLTDEELQLMQELGLGGYPKAEDKAGAYQFFLKVLFLKDTLKAANLNEAELGQAEFPVRTHRWLGLFCEKMGSSGWADLFKQESEITLASSLSRKGFLDKLAITTEKRTHIGSGVSPPRKKGGLFRRKEEGGVNG